MAASVPPSKACARGSLAPGSHTLVGGSSLRQTAAPGGAYGGPSGAARPPSKPGNGHFGPRARRAGPRAASGDDTCSSPFHDDSEMDYSLSSELMKLTAARTSSHLQLQWEIEENPQPEACPSCSGTSLVECQWCHGTGVATLGEEIYCSETGCTPCPICKGEGECKCADCRGTGRIAAWMSRARL